MLMMDEPRWYDENGTIKRPVAKSNRGTINVVRTIDISSGPSYVNSFNLTIPQGTRMKFDAEGGCEILYAINSEADTLDYLMYEFNVISDKVANISVYSEAVASDSTSVTICMAVPVIFL